MSDKRETASADSVRTMERATALTWARGCEQGNACWAECYALSFDQVVEDRLDEWERAVASTSLYWKYTHDMEAAREHLNAAADLDRPAVVDREKDSE